MDSLHTTNRAILCGTAADAPAYSHAAGGKLFYTFPLEVYRLSGNSDIINVLAEKTLLERAEIFDTEHVRIEGEVRSFNNKRGEGAKLVISVLAKSLCFCDDEDCNSVFLRGTLCKEPNIRTTPLGREICDLMLAVNRRYGRSDYLPCICWGSRARLAADWGVGTVVSLNGRLQSRRYAKLTEAGTEYRTAYEISSSDIAQADENEDLLRP